MLEIDGKKMKKYECTMDRMMDAVYLLLCGKGMCGHSVC